MGSVSLREFTVKDRHTSTLWSVAAGRHHKAQLFAFRLRWPKSHILGRDDLTLASPTNALALPARLQACRGRVNCSVDPTTWLVQTPELAQAHRLLSLSL